MPKDEANSELFLIVRRFSSPNGPRVRVRLAGCEAKPSPRREALGVRRAANW